MGRQTAAGAPRVSALVSETGYRAISLDRLVTQAAEMVGADAACLLVRHPEHPEDAIVASAFGMDPDTIGRTVPLVDEHQPELLAGALWSPVPASGGLGLLGVRPASAALAGGDRLAEQADLLGLALEHAGLPRGLISSILEETDQLAASLDAGGPYTLEKAAELDLALSVAEELDVDLARAVELELAVLLYPLGWIAAPEGGAPSLRAISGDGAEFAAVAADTAAHVPGLEPVAAVLRHTEEWFDGSGEPAGLSGERIPLASRIVAVCREYRALVSPRRGRPGLSDARAVETLRSRAGTRFDPRVVTALDAALGDP
jgi:hypothetical protein